ncbi:MAG: DUF2892 domain-containing protein [Gemmatimonadetes bacterium]|nr:DUF2892 domain-containing protein [Gemmatimonadota bacterium]MBI2537217.1 DUF2892 domain-containing protein [Gemmatimonadota bacterium]
MKKNMGTADRVIRTVIALAIVVLYLMGQISGTLAIILGIVALAFLVTSAAARCPSYLPFSISTRKEPSTPPPA